MKNRISKKPFIKRSVAQTSNYEYNVNFRTGLHITIHRIELDAQNFLIDSKTRNQYRGIGPLSHLMFTRS